MGHHQKMGMWLILTHKGMHATLGKGTLATSSVTGMALPGLALRPHSLHPAKNVILHPQSYSSKSIPLFGHFFLLRLTTKVQLSKY